MKSLEGTIKAQSRRLDELKRKKDAAAGALGQAEFNAIHVKRHQKKTAALELEKEELETSNDAVIFLRHRLREPESEHLEIERNRDETLKREQSLDSSIRQGKQHVVNARRSIRATEKTGLYDRYASMFDSIRESLGDTHSTDKLFQRKDA